MPTKKITTKTPSKPKKSLKKDAPVVENKERQNQSKGGSKFYAVGRRKESIARVYYYVSPQMEIQVNNKALEQAFPHILYQNIIKEPFNVSGWQKGKWVIRVTGGGTRGQAESIRLGISRLLTLIDAELRPALKKSKFLTRDPRVKERKKYGLKRARRAPQWQKR